MQSSDDLLSGINLPFLTPDELEMLKRLNEELNPKLPAGIRPISQQQQSNCTCSLQDLMSSGCKCGAFKREKEK